MSERKYKSYAEKLRDPRWQKMRLEIMQRDEFTCLACKSKTETLNVHHRYYEQGHDPWDYPDDALATLCETCHKETEAQRLVLLKNTYGGAQLRALAGLAEAITSGKPSPSVYLAIGAFSEFITTYSKFTDEVEEAPIAEIQEAFTDVVTRLALLSNGAMAFAAHAQGKATK